MDAASREALALVRERAGTPTDQDGLSTTGRDLFAVVGVLDRERTLRRTLADPATDPASRTGLAEQLLSGKISDAALDVVREAVRQRWSAARDLVDSLELLGQESLLAAAEQAGELDTVEDELFRLGRIVAGSTGLGRALGDRSAATEAKLSLVASLVDGKVTGTTRALVDQAVTRLTGEPAEELDRLSRLAARQREQSVARVRTAVALTEQQTQRLTASLSRIYGRDVTVHVELDEAVTGGLVVQVGDEVIDGSTAGRIAELRTRLGR